jgi:glycosyltransferase involved in cell wall biosynthesis
MSDRAGATVSVIMATYNGERFVAAQLESIIQCLHEDDEIVVVDDGSTDNTLQILRSVRWPNLVLLQNPSNLGVRKSFELALRRATGDIIFVCDQDDIWANGKRDAFVAEFDADPLCSVVISDALVIDADGKVICDSFMGTRGGFSAGIPSNFLRNRFLGCAMAVRASALRVALPIPAAVPMHDVWLGMIGGLVGAVRYLPQPYLMYRRHGSNASPATRRSWGQILVSRTGLLYALTRGMMRPPLLRATLSYRRARFNRHRHAASAPS